MIKYYHSGQVGAPELRVQQTSLRNLFDAIFVTGFNVTAVDSITRVGQVATVGINAGHYFENGDIVEVSGADQSEYNGDFVVFNKTISSFDITVSGSPVSPATGSLITKIAPVGWTKYLEVGNKTIYQYPGGQQYYFVLNEDTCTELENYYAGNAPGVTAKVYLAESIIDIDNYENPTELAYLRKGGWTLNDGPYPWHVVVSDRGFYFANNWTSVTGYDLDLHYLGEFNSFLPSDSFNALAAGHTNYTSSSYGWTSMGNYNPMDKVYPPTIGIDQEDPTGIHILRNYLSEEGTAYAKNVQLPLITYSPRAVGSVESIVNFYNPIDNSIILLKSFIKEYAGIRGSLAGLYYPAIKDDVIPLPTILRDLEIGGIDRDILFLPIYPNGMAGIDLTGPWYD